MPIYPGSTTNINLYPTTPTELNISLYPPPEAGSTPALVQYASQTVASGDQAAVAQVLTNTIDVPTTITGSGNVNLVVQAMGFNGGVPLVVPCAVTLADTADDVASKVFAALNGDGTVTGFFYPDFDTGPGKSILTFVTLANTDPWALFQIIPTTATGINASSSTITTPGNAEGCEIDFVGLTIAGAGTTSANGTLKPYLFVNGRQSYIYDGSVDATVDGVYWDGVDRWKNMRASVQLYRRIEDISVPYATGSVAWTVASGASSAPTVSPVITPVI